MSGYEVEGEVHTDKGRIDAVIKDKGRVVVVEIKYGKGKGINKKIEEAMKQIREAKYYEKYASRKEEVALLGIVFGEKKEIRCRFERVS